MPGSRRRRPTAATRRAWLTAAFLARHAGRVDADTLRRTIAQVRRDTPPPTVLDHHAPVRTLGQVDP